MPLPVPNLDDRTFTDLMEEARTLIPSLSPEWTDHNESDPGITLLEIFAWLTEMLIYRANRVPASHIETFLRLLNGPGWSPRVDVDLSEQVRETVVELRRRHRAVTAEDYEALVMEARPDEIPRGGEIARVRCVPERDLTLGTEADRTDYRPGHISMIVLPADVPQPDAALLQQVEGYIEPRRLLTARFHAVGPVYAAVGAKAFVVGRRDVRPSDLRSAVVAALASFLDPYHGGPDGEGWPFGRDVYVSEIYQRLEALPSVDFVPDIELYSACDAGDDRCVEVDAIPHHSGPAVGLRLAAHHLPSARIDPNEAYVTANLVRVPLLVMLSLEDDADARGVRAAVEEVVKPFFHPFYDGPDGNSEKRVSLDDILTRLRSITDAGVQEVSGIEPRVDPHRLIWQNGRPVEVRIRAGELADPSVELSVTNGSEGEPE